MCDLDRSRTRSLKQIMADLDLQKKKEEAAQQRSSIAEALLNIQQSLDLIHRRTRCDSRGI